MAPSLFRAWLKTGKMAEFDRLYKLMEEQPAYKFYVVAGFGGFVFFTGVDRWEKQKIFDEFINHEEARIIAEEGRIKHGDALNCLNVKADTSNPLCRAISWMFGGRSGGPSK